MKTACKRILNIDIKNIKNNKLNDNGIYIDFDEENIMKAKALIIGPKDTIYENGYLMFDINFPNNYPHTPPILKYISLNNIRIHPNIYVNGKVCLSILGTWNGPCWTSVMDISTVLLTIQSLLDNNPILHEPGYENILKSKKGILINDKYNSIVEYNTFNSLILKNYKMNETIFKDIINDIFIKNKEIIINKLKEKSKIDSYECKSIYSLHVFIDYKNLLKQFENL